MHAQIQITPAQLEYYQAMGEREGHTRHTHESTCIYSNRVEEGIILQRAHMANRVEEGRILQRALAVFCDLIPTISPEYVWYVSLPLFYP